MSGLDSVFGNLMALTMGKNEVHRVKYRGTDFLFVGDPDGDGAIALEDDYLNFRQSYAHLMKDGSVMRHGEEIGRREDVQFLGKYEPKL